MKRKKKQIKISKEKVVLSDILPFELPATFSNRHFYNFLVTNKISVDGKIIKWERDDPFLDVIIKLLFGFCQGKEVRNRQIKIEAHNDEFKTIPFNYKISHKEKDYRELVIVHPKSQLQLIEFYDKYKEVILYYCNISPFSIRRPHKVAKFTYFQDRTHLKNLAHDHEHKSAEEFDKEYENLKTFFSYKDISNVYKFYESYKYHRSEKKYNRMFKFDISKCFDSIYSHTIAWALLTKDVVKDNIKLSNKTFAGRFDALMQNLNYAETNGIVIGPEFSRIFAELILQRIDLNVLNCLKAEGLEFKTHYEIFRYVDDFFVFYNEDSDKEKILDTYRLQLKEYKLYINDSKTVLFEKPIITGITIAKQNIAKLLNDNLSFKILKKESEKEMPQDDEGDEEEGDREYSFYVSSNKLITRFKTIIKETGISYKDILNYTLACIDRKVAKIIKIYAGIEDKNAYELKVAKAILELLDFTFFLYSVSPRVNTTIKLCMILSKLTKFTRIKGNFNSDLRHLIYKQIYDDVFLVLRKNRSSKHTQVETLYLLIALKELGREYRLEEFLLGKYFDINIKEEKCLYDLNYFTITVLLFYIEGKSRYNKIREIIKTHITHKFEKVPLNKRIITTELVFLLFDLLSCPYLDEAFKKNLLVYYDITDASQQNNLLSRKGYWFTKWSDFDFGKELEAKRSQEVY
ncbi:MAG: RNA-directed DNA polymerase [Candidatus Omnitrophica bacterium]|nr:RNA-directed DNA polymerase [Candidatus Omnitrophota bacterium]